MWYRIATAPTILRNPVIGGFWVDDDFIEYGKPLNKSEWKALLKTAKTNIFQFPHLWLGVLALFLYVGVEVIAGDTIGLFGSKLAVENATSLTSYTMVFMVIGYVMGLLFIPRVISQQQALFGSAVLGVVFSILIVLSDPLNTSISAVLWGWMGIPLLPDTITYIALLGFANALVWPAVWPLALNGLGKFTKTASALLIMAISGGAILPLLYGKLVDIKKTDLIAQGLSEVVATAASSTSGYWILLPCYLIILYYAFSGHKLGLKSS